MTTSQPAEYILAVDDDPVSLQLVTASLADAGYRLLSADNGVKALMLTHEYRPRVIVADWAMPKMDGIQVCREIRRLYGDQLIYFIMLTVAAGKDCLMEAFEAGVDDFLTKPVHPGELLARIRAGLRMIRMYDELSEGTEALRRTNSELSQLNDKLLHTVCVDELTQLFNRRHAMQRLGELWAVASRYEQPLACAMIDIDQFKSINDQFGHLKGDEVLQRVSAALLANVRASDTVNRLGGDEFLILFPSQSAENVAVWAERCRAAVETSVFVDEARTKPVTISVGVAERKATMSAFDEMLSAADKCLYAAKRLGRNRMMTTEAQADRRAS